jgi:hypothetical protein
MKILEREEIWIHTHFLTDCTSLSTARMREISQRIVPFLRKEGIVYGIHFTQLHDEHTCRIVLECIPFPAVLDRIQHQLRDLVREIPSRPTTTKVSVEEPAKARSAVTR